MSAPATAAAVAAAYAARGWAICPLAPPDCGCPHCAADPRRRGKHPLTAHGLRDATADAAQVEEWWRRWPAANIGYAVPAGRMVLDIDGEPGRQSLAALEAAHGPLPATRTARTGGGGEHRYYSLPDGAAVRNDSQGKLGAALHIRAEGGYVVLPPSVHASGRPYEWTARGKPVPAPGWLLGLLAEPRRPEQRAAADGAIPPGQRYAHLLRLAGAMRNVAAIETEIYAGIAAANLRCSPPKSDAELRALAHDVATRYQPDAAASQREPAGACWEQAEGMGTFLAGADAEIQWLWEPILAPGNLTELAAPRGLGKSLLADYWAVALARQGKRVLILDRDNPRHTLRSRLRGFGAEDDLPLKALPREKCPPLTRPEEWATFPFGDYDLVIVDSLDSMAEGIGEQDSTRPARAMSPLLDISHRDGGPALFLLMNTVKTAAHSRGSGVIEDRADIVFEARDATDFRPSGSKQWIEELQQQPQGADGWAQRSSRRKHRETYRLALACTKFRLGEEPAPCVLEVSTADYPWTVRDVTGDVDAAGEAERQARQQARADALAGAVEALRAEVVRRAQAGEPPILKREAEAWLMAGNRTRKLACQAIGAEVFALVEAEGKGHPKAVLLRGKTQNDGRNSAAQNTAETLGKNDADFARPQPERTGEMGQRKARDSRGFSEAAISPAPPLFTTRRNDTDHENDGSRQAASADWEAL